MPLMKIAVCPFFVLLLIGQLAAEEVYREPEAPNVAAASEEGEQALARFRIPADWQANLFAAEPDVANPVAFKVDQQGRVWVCESFRQGIGVTDNRKHDRDWVNDDLAAQTVGDRLAYHLKHLKDKAIEYARYDDRIRLLVDRDDDGRVDHVQVFSDHYNHIEEGTGAGVLPVGDHVYYSCIPHLWKLTDHDGDGRADARKSLHRGYGVRVAFRGHDMHGMILGPDGKLYYSIGDRGYNVTTSDGRFVDPASGAVFRCHLDGSGLEVVATGLRNPQELAFDDYGNLFTGDNNSDSGDQARWVYVAEGGDSGWRMHYQYLPDRGPFNREKLWHPQHPGQAAYIVPPICNFADGPAGLLYYPGTGLSEHFDQRFFLCDFRGTPSRSGIRTFKLESDGAFFKMVDDEKTLWNVLATDVDFGPDGGLYVTDWVDGWNGEGKGRIYRFVDAEAQATEVVREVRELLGGGLQKASKKQQQAYLGHVDRRVRMQAQFALVDRRAVSELSAAANGADSLLARLHGIWGLGQLVERQQTNSENLQALLHDEEAEVRAQAAKLMGDHDVQAAAGRLLELVRDEHPRVQYFAALSLGKLGDARAVGPVLEMLVENDNRDPILRHGAIMALAGMTDEDLQAAFAHPATEVRLALVVALRKKHSPRVAALLRDSDALVVREAARAIHDAVVAPGEGESVALAALADSLARPTQDVAFIQRALNANYRLGQAPHASAIADFAADAQAPVPMRLEALQMLAQWAEPSPRDRVLGRWHPLAKRDAQVAASAMRRKLASIVARAPDRIRVAAVTTAARLGLADAAIHLRALVVDGEQEGRVRSDALASLAAMDSPSAVELAVQTLQDREPIVRAEAMRILARKKPSLAIDALGKAIHSTAIVERQAALMTLATLQMPAARKLVATAARDLFTGQAPPETHLEILEAAERSKDPEVQRQLQEFRERASAGSATKQYAETMFGGDPAQGRKIFFEKVSVSCIRCHRIENTGGRVGPNLDERVAEWSQLLGEQKRWHLLESLVEPSKKIVKGFQSVLIVNDEGEVISGVKAAESKTAIQIVTAEAKTLNIAKESIEQMRVSDKSAMPDDIVKSLSRRELRDLVEYLATHQKPKNVVETEE